MVMASNVESVVVESSEVILQICIIIMFGCFDPVNILFDNKKRIIFGVT